jgi:hypothetical protein
MAASNGFFNIDVPNAFAKMDCRRMISGMHAQRFGIVIDGDVRRSTERHFNAGAGASATGEVVDYHAADGRRIRSILRKYELVSGILRDEGLPCRHCGELVRLMAGPDVERFFGPAE